MKFIFTCGKSDLQKKIENLQNIMTGIVGIS